MLTYPSGKPHALSNVSEIKNNQFERGHVACTRDKRNVHTELWWGNLRATDHMEYLNVNGKISKWIFI